MSRATSATSGSTGCLALPATRGRARASSTGIRPPLTIDSVASRRRSNSLDLPTPTTAGPSRDPTPPTPGFLVRKPSSAPKPPNNSFSGTFSALLQCVRSDPQQPFLPSWPSSRRSSTDYEPIIPMSALPHKTSFDIAERPRSTRRPWLHSPSIHAPMVFVIILFPLSTACILFAVWTLPLEVAWPHNLSDVAQLGRELQGYSQSGLIPQAHVIGVLALSAVWKHAWSIPGSVIWNILAGALFSPWFGTLLMAVLTTTGSVASTLLATPLSPLLTQWFPKALALTRVALEGGSESDETASPTATPADETLSEATTVVNHNGREDGKAPAWIRLSILRLIGVVPWSGINIACGVCGVALFDCMLGAFIGTLPWTAVTCQIGDILSTVASSPTPNSTSQTVQSLLMTPAILFKLAFLTILSLAPILGRSYLKALLASASSSASSSTSWKLGGHEDSEDERARRWTWVRQWRAKVRRSPSEDSATSTFIGEEIDLPEMKMEEDMP